MSEEYPLLYEDVSEEEKFDPRYHRRSHSMTIRGRVRNHVKGAAAIIKQWPDYWTTLLAYWWIGLGMIALTTFIIYNTLFSFAMFQPTNTKPVKSLNGIIKQYKNSLKPYDVYMHVFVNGTEAVNLNKYFPYIDIVSNENKEFKFHFIIVVNDTNGPPNLSEELNNELALNTILNTGKNNNKVDTNIVLEHVSLSKYLNTSPIQKYWRSLPRQFIRFLVRAMSIWEKGGIAVNPVVFTPQSPNPIYIEKVKKLFTNFIISDINKVNNGSDSQKSVVINKERKATPRPNNIQDILNEFENEDTSSYSSPTLEVAESRHIINISDNNKSLSDQHYKKNTSTENHLKHLSDKINVKGERKIHSHQEEGNTNGVSKMLPKFLNYLFHKDPLTNSSVETKSTLSTTSKTISGLGKVNQIKSNEGTFKPMIVKVKEIGNDSKIASSVKKKFPVERFELTVDLKGNLLATKTPCHAFIGDMFTNAVHHDETETLTDFIIKELSIFCKGLLSSCVGIDIILI